MTGNSRSNANSKRRWGRAVLGAVLGMAVLIGSAGIGARAADEEEVDNAPDIKAIRSFLHALGLRRDGEDGIEYRERSPLVVPPARTLPLPESKSAATKTAGWPDDPDVKREKKARAERRKPAPSVEEQERVLLPNELNVPTQAGTRVARQGNSKTAEESERPSTNNELGAKSIFSSVGLGLGLGNLKERATFTREPQRNSLTEPPPGYLTPSPNQPYGIGQQPWKPSDIPERHNDNTR